MIEPVNMSREPADVGEYCRRVEEHLAKANAGHLVRIAGAGFELVRGWAEAGVPLSVVQRGIDQKVERHRAGRSRRPLRIEFCEADVRTVFDDWQRAVGVAAAAPSAPGPVADEGRRPSLGRHLDRAIAALMRAAGRLDTPEAVRDHLTRALQTLVTLQETAHGARGSARDVIVAHLAACDRDLMTSVRAAVPAAVLETIQQQAESDLAAYRARLPVDAWSRSVDAAMDRLVRDRFAVPVLEP